MNGTSEVNVEENGLIKKPVSGADAIAIATKELPDEIFESDGLEQSRESAGGDDPAASNIEPMTNGHKTEETSTNGHNGLEHSDNGHENLTANGDKDNESAEEEEEGEEDIPLSHLVTKVEEMQEEKVQLISQLPQLSHIRGRSALRDGSSLGTSFTVRSEPSSPAGVSFPKLHKAEGKLSLNTVTPRKRQHSPEPEGSSPFAKRPAHGWLHMVSQWWKGEEPVAEAEQSNEMPAPDPPAKCNLITNRNIVMKYGKELKKMMLHGVSWL